jgi:hypothetical protein
LSNQSLAQIIVRRTVAHLKPEINTKHQSLASFVRNTVADVNEMSNGLRNKLMLLSTNDSGPLNADEVSAILETTQTIVEVAVAIAGVL